MPSSPGSGLTRLRTRPSFRSCVRGKGIVQNAGPLFGSRSARRFIQTVLGAVLTKVLRMAVSNRVIETGLPSLAARLKSLSDD